MWMGVRAMTKKRENSADRLADILELIYARSYSGLLSVERFEGGRFEEGEIYFEMGRPVYAHTGHNSGGEAFSRLIEWRQTYFFFDKDAPHPSVPPVVPRAPKSLEKPAITWQVSDSEQRKRAGHVPPHSTPAPFRDDRIIPRKLVSGVDVQTLSLMRIQRLVYLLVDGQRSIADLARCLSKSPASIKSVLDELQEQGLIFM